jgi:hypothetical protein
MWGDPEPSLREQLIEARAKIIAQLDELQFRSFIADPARRGDGGPPDYRSIYAELEGQLREIDALLDSYEGQS